MPMIESEVSRTERGRGLDKHNHQRAGGGLPRYQWWIEKTIQRPGERGSQATSSTRVYYHYHDSEGPRFRRTRTLLERTFISQPHTIHSFGIIYHIVSSPFQLPVSSFRCLLIEICFSIIISLIPSPFLWKLPILCLCICSSPPWYLKRGPMQSLRWSGLWNAQKCQVLRQKSKSDASTVKRESTWLIHCYNQSLHQPINNGKPPSPPFLAWEEVAE